MLQPLWERDLSAQRLERIAAAQAVRGDERSAGDAVS
jgi:KDO2-lipid IV(A) lauroyltransferase